MTLAILDARAKPVGILQMGENTAMAAQYAAAAQSAIDEIQSIIAEDREITGAVELTVGGAAITARRAVQVNCSVAGTITLLFAGGSTLPVPVNAGLSILPFAVTGVSASSAVATIYSLAVAQRAYNAATLLVADAAAITAGMGVAINCTVPGNVALTLKSGETAVLPVSAGLSILPFAATRLLSAGTTAIATVHNLTRSVN